MTALLTGPLDGKTDSGRWENDVVSETAFKFGTVGYNAVQVEERFRSWLETTISSGLGIWGEDL